MAAVLDEVAGEVVGPGAQLPFEGGPMGWAPTAMVGAVSRPEVAAAWSCCALVGGAR
ncbi:hypothetical protein [Streptomyces decoyicus]|uniref:hypothetical protein n=1 Tax=Streptomyces decoyicus TaxID=249567 RepID=UPI003C12B5BA